MYATSPNMVDGWRRASRRALGLATLTVALQACVGDLDEDAPGTTGGDGTLSSATMRRLSVHELERTFEQVLGFVPEAMERMPPDGSTHSFDRVVNAQTMSPAHLDAFVAIADEAASVLVGERRLADLTASCPAEAIPNLVASALVTVDGNALSLGPDWAVSPSADPKHGTTIYAPDPSAAFTQELPSAGTYRVTADLGITGIADLVELRIDDVPVASQTQSSGATHLEADVDIASAGSHVVTLSITTEPDDNSLVVVFERVTFEGPVPTGVVDAEAVRSCALGAIDELAPLLQRHPLAEADRARLVSLYDNLVPEQGPAAALKGLLDAIVQSPRTLYQVEVGQTDPSDPSRWRLDAWELAARLSYALCEMPPDPELRAAAASGQLDSDEGLRAQAERLMNAPCARLSTERFVEQWLHLQGLPTLNKSPEAFAAFTPEARDSLVAETKRFVTELVFVEQAPLSRLFDADYAWPSAASAALWGLAGANGERLTLPPERAGLLTSPALLASTASFDGTSPVLRGVFVLEQLLCDGTPPPPEDLEIVPPLPDSSLTTRERWAAHSNNPGCLSCHQVIDPVGFAFEDFDGIGRHRSEENGLPVDASGGVPSVGVDDGALVGGAAAARAIAASAELRACAGRQWLRSALGRLETTRDEATLDALASAFDAQSMRDAMLALVTTETFRHRLAEELSP